MEGCVSLHSKEVRRVQHTHTQILLSYIHACYRQHLTKPEETQAIYLATTSKCANPLAAARHQR
jgi:hypothetical protein